MSGPAQFWGRGGVPVWHTASKLSSRTVHGSSSAVRKPRAAACFPRPLRPASRCGASMRAAHTRAWRRGQPRACDAGVVRGRRGVRTAHEGRRHSDIAEREGRREGAHCLVKSRGGRLWEVIAESVLRCALPGGQTLILFFYFSNNLIRSEWQGLSVWRQCYRCCTGTSVVQSSRTSELRQIAFAAKWRSSPSGTTCGRSARKWSTIPFHSCRGRRDASPRAPLPLSQARSSQQPRYKFSKLLYVVTFTWRMY